MTTITFSDVPYRNVSIHSHANTIYLSEKIKFKNVDLSSVCWKEDPQQQTQILSFSTNDGANIVANVDKPIIYDMYKSKDADGENKFVLKWDNIEYDYDNYYYIKRMTLSDGTTFHHARWDIVDTYGDYIRCRVTYKDGNVERRTSFTLKFDQDKRSHYHFDTSLNEKFWNCYSKCNSCQYKGPVSDFFTIQSQYESYVASIGRLTSHLGNTVYRVENNYLLGKYLNTDSCIVDIWIDLETICRIDLFRHILSVQYTNGEFREYYFASRDCAKEIYMRILNQFDVSLDSKDDYYIFPTFRSARGRGRLRKYYIWKPYSENDPNPNLIYILDKDHTIIEDIIDTKRFKNTKTKKCISNFTGLESPDKRLAKFARHVYSIFSKDSGQSDDAAHE